MMRVKVGASVPARLEQMARSLGYLRPAGQGVTVGHIGAMLDAIAAGRLRVEGAK